MNRPPYNILFLCTGNSARSIIAESLANGLGDGRFRGFSAGSQPSGRVQPLALKVLRDAGLSVEGARSKSMDEFAAPGAPEMDVIITVCDNAAGEVCPVWPGQPVTAHWGVEDPVPHDGSEPSERDFQRAMQVLRRRFELLASLKMEALDRLSLRQALSDIGREG